MSMHSSIDIAEIKATYYYADGRLRFRAPMGKAKAEYLLPNGYRYAYVGGRLQVAHRIIWAMHYGDPGDLDIDHIDGNKTNNKLVNLRVASRSQNNQNRRAAQSNNETSGVMGVHYDRSRKKWAASLNLNGEKVFFQRFETKEEAMAARKQAEEKYFTHKEQ